MISPGNPLPHYLFMEKETSFFDRLTFDSALNQTFIARYFRNIRTIILLVVTLSLAGLATYFSLPRELNPSIQIPNVFVSTAFPGAGPEDIENLLTVPIEDAVNGLSGVTKVSSTSQENFSSVIIEFGSGTDPEKAKRDVQSAIDSISSLPEDAKTPKVQVLDFQDQPVINFVLSGSVDSKSLTRFADTLKDTIKGLSGVEKVNILYRQEEAVTVTLKPAVLRERHLSPLTVAKVIEEAVSSHPAGNVSTDSTTFALTVATAAHSVAELRALPIVVGQSIVPLGELALIVDAPAHNSAQSYYADQNISPVRNIAFSVFKTDTADTTAVVEAVLNASQKLSATYGDQFVIEPVFNGAHEIKKKFDQLFHDFALTLLLVFTVLFCFFGLRQSIIAALAIPLTFLGTFMVMRAFGISINFIALFSLLLALGILVDNAIVIISAMANYERTKKFTPDETALLVWRDFRAVIFTTTITTVWAFLPLLLATGIIGEFIKPIPIVVSSALAISAVIALLVVIPLMAMFLKGDFPRRVIMLIYVLLFALCAFLLFLLIPAGPFRFLLFLLALLIVLLLFTLVRSLRHAVHTYEASHFKTFFVKLHRISTRGLFDFDSIAHRYEKFIGEIIADKTSRRKTIAALILFSFFSYALVPFGYVVNEFFPGDNLDIVYVSVELPKNTTVDESSKVARSLLETFRHFPETHFVTAEIAAAAPSEKNNIAMSNDFNKLLFTFLLAPANERTHTSAEIVSALNKQYGNYNQGALSASQLSGGPPAGSDLELKLLGSDLSTIETYGKKVSDFLKGEAGITAVNTSIATGASKIVFEPNKELFAKNGLNENDSAFLLRTLGSGFTIKSDARLGEDKRDIILYLGDSASLENPATLSTLTLHTANGDLPLGALGTFTLKPNPTLITREDGKRTLSISASVAAGYSVSTKNKALEQFATTLNLPTGYSWKTGGVNDENNKSVQSILQAMLLSALLIFGTMAIQFNSFRKALIVLLVVPLAVSGVFILFALSGTPLSFPALIGILALFGIVVNNSIIMVDKINRNMASGLPLNQAISEGAASRLEPILLTALTTIVGLIPITLSDPIWQGLGGAIIAGLTFSGVAKLFFIPVIYRIWFGEKQSLTDEHPRQAT